MRCSLCVTKEDVDLESMPSLGSNAVTIGSLNMFHSATKCLRMIQERAVEVTEM